MTDLKPCPFCGSANLSPARVSKQYINCNSCGCYGPFVGSHDAWNSRATPEAVAAAPVAEVDKARLDSGCIVILSRDEFGEPQTVEHRGIDLRAAIDAAISSSGAKADTARRGADDDGR